MNLCIFFSLYQEIKLRHVTENSIVNVKILDDFVTKCLLIISKHLVSQLNYDAENVINLGNTLHNNTYKEL